MTSVLAQALAAGRASLNDPSRDRADALEGIRRPLGIDLFCGLGGWTDGLLAEGYDVIGFDIEHHVYGDHRYPAQLVIQDVLTLHGSQFKDAVLIVASPPCQAYSYRAMPWKKAKALPPPDNALFDACFRIQREACEAAGRHIPLVVENVRGAQKWVGRARWNFGSFYLWGDVPALMPARLKRHGIKCGGDWFNASQLSISRMTSSKSRARKMASAMIAKIPLALSRHIAATFRFDRAIAIPTPCDSPKTEGRSGISMSSASPLFSSVDLLHANHSEGRA